nr:MAG TPA: hypothetical protein [Caudoviricetes sp.]
MPHEFMALPVHERALIVASDSIVSDEMKKK